MPRGGARPGSGPKPKAEKEKTQKRNFTLSYEAAEYLKSKENASQYVDQLILEDIKRNSEK